MFDVVLYSIVDCVVRGSYAMQDMERYQQELEAAAAMPLPEDDDDL